MAKRTLVGILARIPSDRTVVNWLKQFTQCSLRALTRNNSELLYEQIEQKVNLADSLLSRHSRSGSFSPAPNQLAIIFTTFVTDCARIYA
jgi:hypothetical protein